MILTRFPKPSTLLRQALHELSLFEQHQIETIADLELDLDALPRPWDPATCDAEMRQQLWDWCDLVAEWVNRTHLWRPGHMIPACWPRHAHLAAELPVLACLRWRAGEAAAVDALEEWHRYTLPTFLDRMAGRVGDSSCRTGKHQPWPGEGRFDSYCGADAAEDRQDVFFRDTHPPTDLAVAAVGARRAHGNAPSHGNGHGPSRAGSPVHLDQYRSDPRPPED